VAVDEKWLSDILNATSMLPRAPDGAGWRGGDTLPLPFLAEDQVVCEPVVEESHNEVWDGVKKVLEDGELGIDVVMIGRYCVVSTCPTSRIMV
jgi:hypothetical protein